MTEKTFEDYINACARIGEDNKETIDVWKDVIKEA